MFGSLANKRGWMFPFLLVALMGVALTGCATDKDLSRLNAQQAATIQSLNQEIIRLNAELDELMQSREDLIRAKRDIENNLQSELASGDMTLSMQSRGLVVTVLDRILFDSGKSELKDSAQTVLNKVADVLTERVDENMIFVEGHTDNVPIRYSGWRSNWELSTARATEVIHYFIETKGLNPKFLAATGYGQFQPVASNETPDGQLANRRVEIVISPKKLAPAPVGV